MKITFAAASTPKTGTIIVPVMAENRLGKAGAALDQQTGGMLSRAIAASRFTGKKDDVLAVLSPTGLEASRVLLIGLGKPAELTDLVVQDAGGNALALLNKTGESEAALLADADADAGAALSAAQIAANFRLWLALARLPF